MCEICRSKSLTGFKNMRKGKFKLFQNSSGSEPVAGMAVMLDTRVYIFNNTYWSRNLLDSDKPTVLTRLLAATGYTKAYEFAQSGDVTLVRWDEPVKEPEPKLPEAFLNRFPGYREERRGLFQLNYNDGSRAADQPEPVEGFIVIRCGVPYVVQKEANGSDWPELNSEYPGYKSWMLEKRSDYKNATLIRWLDESDEVNKLTREFGLGTWKVIDTRSDNWLTSVGTVGMLPTSKEAGGIATVRCSPFLLL